MTGSRVRRPAYTYARIGLALALAFGALAAGAGYWQVFRASDLSQAADDPAVVAAARNVLRGTILDRDGDKLAWNKRDANGEPYRVYASRSISGVIGYSSRIWGSSGFERAYDAQLSGVRSGDEVRDLLRKFSTDPSDPRTLKTSISLKLQDAAVKALGKDRGAVVMLDPRTGEVLVLASTPTYDASAVADPTTAREAFAALQGDDARPLLARATQGLYVPGSVFKIVTAIAALGSGAVSPSTTFPQQPAAEKTGLLVSGFRIRDGHHAATGTKALDFEAATEVSCNIWYALAGIETGGARLADWATRLGFGAPLPFDLPTATSQLTNGGGSFGGGFSDIVELANAAYGQAETLVTPLQMALVASTVANGGVLMKPHLLLSSTGKSGTVDVGPEQWRRVLPQEVAAEITAAMQRAVEGPLGRAFTKGSQVAGMHVAGKSGSAQLDQSSRPHSWFIGFAPADDPQVAIAVVVERGGFGSQRAAPIAGSMLAAWKAWAKP